MKSIVVLFALCMFGISASAQKIYSVDAEYKAQVKVYVVDAEYKADLLVYKENAEYKAGDNDGRWYFVDAEYKAGWKNTSKKHLLY